MIREYFNVQLSDSIYLGLPLTDMTVAIQFEWQDICTVPGVASFWHGVVNLKGSLLWVLDTDSLFDFPDKSDRAQFQNLIQKPVAVVLTQQIEGTQRRVALVVKKLKGIIGIESNNLQSLAKEESPILQQICTAMTKQENQAIYILNSEVFLQHLYRQSTF